MQMKGQCPSKESLLSWIDQVSFAVVEMTLYLDSHPNDEDAIAFFREKLAQRNAAMKLYAQNYGPLTIDTANDRMSRSWDWVMQPWPWEPARKGGC
ncbi:MAG: spore coat protein CotJB [Fusicatenibacter sp.]|nr:spore coat protein CotJB [Fusicatenibacter sp.]